jgi:5-methylcytosine-specific restriction endonuclease McrA
MAPNPKPESYARVKARRQRSEAQANRLVYRAVDARDGQCCRVCGIYCGASIHRHHIKFRSLGGLTTLENLKSVCQRCHRAIHERTPEVGA